MTPVDQTAFEEKGNCLAACLATVFGEPLEELPDFLTGPWKKKLRDWAEARGYSASFIALHPAALRQFAEEFAGPLIMCGSSPRGRKHATVWTNGEPFHDPHPSRAYLVSCDYAIVFVPLSYGGKANEPA